MIEGVVVFLCIVAALWSLSALAFAGMVLTELRLLRKRLERDWLVKVGTFTVTFEPPVATQEPQGEDR